MILLGGLCCKLHSDGLSKASFCDHGGGIERASVSWRVSSVDAGMSTANSTVKLILNAFSVEDRRINRSISEQRKVHPPLGGVDVTGEEVPARQQLHHHLIFHLKLPSQSLNPSINYQKNIQWPSQHPARTLVHTSNQKNPN